MNLKTALQLHRINVMRRRRLMQSAASAPPATVTEVGGLAVVALARGTTTEDGIEEAVKASNAGKKPTTH